ncbi:glycosyltransferase [Algibacter mikhailovii]|uniref:glycosyltransferase n=1 Tax=Algibacter mikhailovii TaxID=425498 RepID=UPI002494A0E0|nr:glycosyltransferase [Algibacter mikhailovii]
MKVLQLIDSLEAGGAERMAVNIANVLSTKIEGSYLCATRKEGLLRESLSKNVGYLFLNKTKTIDLGAIKRINAFVREAGIQVVHAHSTSFFLATIIKLLNWNISIIWHDHYGNSEFLEQRKFAVLKWCSLFFTHVFSVNKVLEVWAKQNLKIKHISYLPNFATINKMKGDTVLRGDMGKRLVCLANFRPQKDHMTLLKSFEIVSKTHPDWTLHCIGQDFQDEYAKSIRSKIIELGLENVVFLYPSKSDIFNILSQCDIGVLSSKSEGLPLALLEYGLVKLAVVTTKVGECEVVISDTNNGLLVDPMDAKSLAEAITLYIENPEMRTTYSHRFNKHIQDHYSQDSQIRMITNIYKKALVVK